MYGLKSYDCLATFQAKTRFENIAMLSLKILQLIKHLNCQKKKQSALKKKKNTIQQSLVNWLLLRKSVKELNKEGK